MVSIMLCLGALICVIFGAGLQALGFMFRNHIQQEEMAFLVTGLLVFTGIVVLSIGGGLLLKAAIPHVSDMNFLTCVTIAALINVCYLWRRDRNQKL